MNFQFNFCNTLSTPCNRAHPIKRNNHQFHLDRTISLKQHDCTTPTSAKFYRAKLKCALVTTINTTFSGVKPLQLLLPRIRSNNEINHRKTLLLIVLIKLTKKWNDDDDGKVLPFREGSDPSLNILAAGSLQRAAIRCSSCSICSTNEIKFNFYCYCAACWLLELS